MTFVDGDARRPESLDKAANELEDLGLLAVRKITGEFGAKEFEQEGGGEGGEDEVT